MERTWRFGAATHVGFVRAVNEDFFHVDPREGLILVADGMGGHGGGDVAACVAVEAARQSFLSSRGSPESRLAQALSAAHEAVLRRAAVEPELAGMGTTLVAAQLSGESLSLAWAGDSRLYAATPSGLFYATRDHSPVQQMVERGELTREEAAVHPLRNLITRAVGVSGETEPESASLALPPGARVVVFTDGLNKMLDDPDIFNLLFSAEDPGVLAQKLVDEANRRGGLDNTTVVVAVG